MNCRAVAPCQEWGRSLLSLPELTHWEKIQDDVQGEEQERCVNLLGISVGQEPPQPPKAHTLGKIHEDIQGEGQERCVNLLGVSWRALSVFVAGFPHQN